MAIDISKCTYQKTIKMCPSGNVSLYVEKNGNNEYQLKCKDKDGDIFSHKKKSK